MKILVTKPIPDFGIQMLISEGHEVNILDGNRKKILKELRNGPYDAMITLLTDDVDEEMMAAGQSLKIIANYAVGFNNIDLDAAKAHNIYISNTPGVLTNTVAEHTVSMIMAAAARVVEADTFVRNKKFTGWEPQLLLGKDLKGKTLGVVGAGRIGSRVAEIMHKGFGMDIVYTDISRNEWLDKNTSAKFCIAPEDLIKEADVITVHLPLNEHTHHFFGATRLSLLKQSAILVNSSRGPVIDEEALINALENKKIFAAALDVFEFEPKVARRMRKLSNITLSPHTASASEETRNAMSRICAENIINVFGGGMPTTEVKI